MIIKPCLVFSSGVAATGKSTVLKELVKKVENSLYIDRDDINKGNLHVAIIKMKDLPDFEDYVSKDDIFPYHAKKIQTPFDEMWQLEPQSAFYRRHIRDQSYLIQAEIAKTNLDLGKAPIIDCVVMRQIKDGTIRKFMDYHILAGYKKLLIHFIADEKDCRERIIERAKSDPYATTRIEFKMAQSEETFHRFVTEDQPMVPKELFEYKHLMINTSQKRVDECVKKSLEYILSETGTNQ